MTIVGKEIPTRGLNEKVIAACFVNIDQDILRTFVYLFKDDPSSPFHYNKLYPYLVRKNENAFWLRNISKHGLSSQETQRVWEQLLPVVRDERPEFIRFFPNTREL